MKRFPFMVLLVLASLVAVVALAQEATQHPSYGKETPSGLALMQGGMMGQRGGMMGMMQMMRHCAAMMETMSGEMMNGMGMKGNPMGSGMMDSASESRYDRQDAEMLARAFLAGHDPGAVITEVTAVSGGYQVRYRRGDVQAVLQVDAVTGEVSPIDEDQ